MKSVHKQLVVAACLAVLGAAASAQPAQPAIVAPGGPPGAGRPIMQEHFARMQRYVQRREAELKQVLQITPAQEGAWDTWIASRRPPANLERPRPGEFAQLTTPERIDRLRALRAQRIAEMDRRGDATKAFYAALTPSQQKAFDALAAMRMGRFGGHHRGGWGARG